MTTRHLSRRTGATTKVESDLNWVAVFPKSAISADQQAHIGIIDATFDYMLRVETPVSSGMSTADHGANQGVPMTSAVVLYR